MDLWEGSEPRGLQEGQQTGPEHLFWRFLWPSCCPTHLSAAFLRELFSKLAAATSWQTDGLRFGLFPQDRNQTILAQSCASGARRGVEEGTVHEHVGKGKNQMCYNGRQSRDFSSHNIKMAHMARSSMGPLMDVGFPSLFSLMTNFHPAKLWKGEVLNTCRGRTDQAVPSSHWALETLCDSLGFGFCVYSHKTSGSVTEGIPLKGWSPVILPLSHRVSLKVQVK